MFKSSHRRASHFWEQHFSREDHRKRNLQDGLFQIASQTCSLLVQVNNTNNISYGNNSNNIQMNSMPSMGMAGSSGSNSRSRAPSTASSCSKTSAADREQLIVLMPPNGTNKSTSGHHGFCKYRPGILAHKAKLPPVPETPTSPNNDDDLDIWGAGAYAITDDNHSGRWGGRNKWCRPSCIPISIICILIFLVVLLPVLNNATEKALQELNASTDFCNKCRLNLVESIPEGLVYPNDSVVHPSTFDTWSDLIDSAQKSIEIASLYWTLQKSEVYPDPSSIKGDKIFQSLLKAGTDRGISIRITQNQPSKDNANEDTELLVKRKAAQVRSLNFAKLMGAGVLHTKLWIVDRKHVYIGSANMDWRSLTQVKEMGIAVYNCSCIAEDVAKVFEVYWKLGEENAKIPSQWPTNLYTKYNLKNPMNLEFNNDTLQTYISSSPAPFNPIGRTNDIDALTNVIKHAEKFVYIAVMDYFPLMIYSPKLVFWSVIDDALKTAAIENKIKVKMLISRWNHSRTSEDNFLKSLASINKAYPRVSVEIRRFIVPASAEQQKIPFARVNHNKYMVSDNTAYIGTSNWSGDYFTNTAGVSFVVHDPAYYDRNQSHMTIRSQLQEVFERDWNSEYAHPLNENPLS